MTNVVPLRVIQVLADIRDLDWMDEAACAEIGPGGDFWFPEVGMPAKPAKRICAVCPVKAECLEYALENKIRHGIWGGTVSDERDEILRERRSVAA